MSRNKGFVSQKVVMSIDRKFEFAEIKFGMRYLWSQSLEFPLPRRAFDC